MRVIGTQVSVGVLKKTHEMIGGNKNG